MACPCLAFKKYRTDTSQFPFRALGKNDMQYGLWAEPRLSVVMSVETTLNLTQLRLLRRPRLVPIAANKTILTNSNIRCKPSRSPYSTVTTEQVRTRTHSVLQNLSLAHGANDFRVVFEAVSDIKCNQSAPPLSSSSIQMDWL